MLPLRVRIIHLLKLVTGVEISTRAVNRSGSPGKPVKRSSRTAAAAPNSVAFLLSILIIVAISSDYNGDEEVVVSRCLNRKSVLEQGPL